MRRALLVLCLVLGRANVWAATPTVAATAVTADVTTGTTQVINLPSSISAGDLLLVTFYGSGLDSVPHTTATGWTQLLDKVIQTNLAHMYVGYRIADGGEGSTVTFTTDVTENAGGCAYRITGWHGTTPPEISTGVESAASTAPDPDAVTPSWGAEANLFIAVGGADGTNVDFTVYPTNYDGSQITSPTHTSGGGACALATRALTATSDDPGAFTIDTSVIWAAATIAVRPGTTVAGRTGGTLMGVGP